MVITRAAGRVNNADSMTPSVLRVSIFDANRIPADAVLHIGNSDCANWLMNTGWHSLTSYFVEWTYINILFIKSRENKEIKRGRKHSFAFISQSWSLNCISIDWLNWKFPFEIALITRWCNWLAIKFGPISLMAIIEIAQDFLPLFYHHRNLFKT